LAIRLRFRNTVGKDVHPHELRHWFATFKINVEKQDLKAVSLYLGHADIATSLRFYVDTSLDVKKAGIKI
jgi:site-specific recombinase XerC